MSLCTTKPLYKLWKKEHSEKELIILRHKKNDWTISFHQENIAAFVFVAKITMPNVN